MNVTDLFKRNSLLFESSFGNVLFLKNEDMDFLKSFSKFFIDRDSIELEQEMKLKSQNSPVFNMLHTESIALSKKIPRIFWEQDTDNTDEKNHNLLIATSNGYYLKSSKKYVLSKLLRPDRVFLCVSLIKDWVEYYLPKSINDSIDNRCILQSVKSILANQETKKEIIVRNVSNEIATVIKQKET